jgi:hypothetical protein
MDALIRMLRHIADNVIRFMFYLGRPTPSHVTLGLRLQARHVAICKLIGLRVRLMFCQWVTLPVYN